MAQYNHEHAVRIEVGGVSKTIPEWASQCGIDSKTLRARLKFGMSPEEAVSLPARKTRGKSPRRKIEFNGRTWTMLSLSRFLGINYNTLKDRIKRGVSIQEAVKKYKAYNALEEWEAQSELYKVIHSSDFLSILKNTLFWFPNSESVNAEDFYKSGLTVKDAQTIIRKYKGENIKISSVTKNAFTKALRNHIRRHFTEEIKSDRRLQQGVFNCEIHAMYLRLPWLIVDPYCGLKWNSYEKLKRLCKEKGCSLTLAKNRINLGWSIEEAVSEPSRGRYKTVEIEGKLYTMKSLSKELGGSGALVGQRLKIGWNMDEATSITKRDGKNVRSEVAKRTKELASLGIVTR